MAAIKLIEKSNKLKFDSLNNEANIIGCQHENIIKMFKVCVIIDSNITFAMDVFAYRLYFSCIDINHIKIWHCYYGKISRYMFTIFDRSYGNTYISSNLASTA